MKNQLLSSFVDVLKMLCRRFPVATVRTRYFLRFGHFPNLKHPQDLNEKILHLKLYSDTSSWTRLADKYKVRKYVEKCGLGDMLIPIYGAWSRVEDIPFDELPEAFILKANNGDGKGTNVKVSKNRMNETDWQRLKRRLQRWLDDRYIGSLSAEPQYKDIKPLILAEQLLTNNNGETSLTDYKLWCFNGKPFSFLTCSNRMDNGYQVELGCYDLQWNFQPEKLVPTKHATVARRQIPPPQCLQQMIDAAHKLSKPFPQVRVDMYEVDGKVYFGELTFTSLGGMMNYYTPDYLLEMGKHVTFPKHK